MQLCLLNELLGRVPRMERWQSPVECTARENWCA